MLYVDSNGIIRLTRGDTARLTIHIKQQPSEEEYEIRETDVLTLSIRKKTTGYPIVVKKVIEGSSTFHIEPSDTERLEFGKYVYDVQLQNEFGDVYTVVAPTRFDILEEVTYDGQ